MDISQKKGNVLKLYFLQIQIKSVEKLSIGLIRFEPKPVRHSNKEMSA